MMKKAILKIELPDDEIPGSVDVRYWLDDGEKRIGVADVRVFFEQTDQTLDDLVVMAYDQSSRILGQIVQQLQSGQADANLPQSSE